jgi:hypothetical protein
MRSLRSVAPTSHTDVVGLVRRASARERSLARVAVICSALAAPALIAALAVLLLGNGRWISLPAFLPAILVAAGLLAALAIAAWGWRVVEVVARPERLAGAVERERSLRRGSLTGLLELPRADAFALRAAARVGRSLHAGDLAPARAAGFRRRSATGLALLVVTTVAFAGASVVHPDGLHAMAHPLDALRGALLGPLELVNVPHAVRRGQSVTLQVRAPERRTISLHTRVAGSSWRVASAPVLNGIANVRIGPVNAVTMVYASDARGHSATAAIAPSDKPFVADLAFQAVYPRHLVRPSEPLATGAPLTLPRGTEIRIRGRASVALYAVELQSGTTSIPLASAGTAFTGSVTVRGSAEFAWRLTARNGEDIEPPEPLRVDVIGDMPPGVEIMSPAGDTSVAGDAPVMVQVRAADDHALASVALHVRRGSTERVLPLSIGRSGGSTTVLLDVAPLGAGERLTIEAVAVEAAPARQRASSGPRGISIRTAGEQRREARAAADSASLLAASIAAAQRESERRTADLAAARGERRTGERDTAAANAGHALASRARAAVDDQRALATRADSLAAATRAVESRLARAGAMDDGLAARLAEVRSLLQRALTPELAARLRDAEQAARQNSEEPLRRALSDVAQQQRRAREQLERVVRMLRRAAIEGALATLRAEAEELSAATTRQPNESASRINQLERDIARVIAQLREEGARAGVPPAEAARAHAQSAAGSVARSGAGLLHAAGESLGDARAAQIEEWKSELAGDLDAAVQELVQLSTAQEALSRTLRRPETWRESQAELAESAAAVAERIAAAARLSSLVSPRSDGLVRSARDRVARVGAPAVPARDLTQTGALMRDAAAALSRAAASLVRDRERTNSARSASGFTELLEELQRLAAEQRGINAAVSGLPLLSGGGGPGSEADRARELARQQRGVARALEELGDADGGGRAQPLAAEAHRLADALERAAIDPSVLARQERLYHRLLEGGRLLSGGEEDERREAIAAETVDFPLARELGDAHGQDRRHRLPSWAELRSLTAAERQMVLDYFERLNVNAPR